MSEPNNEPNPPAPKGVSGEDFRPIIDHWKADAAAARAELAAEKARVAKVEEDAKAAKKASDDALKEKESDTTRRLIMAHLRVAAKEAGIVDLDVLKLADTSKLTMDDAGDVPGTSDFIKTLKEAKPYAFKVTAQDTGTTTGGKPPGKLPDGAKQAKDMTDAEYRAARAELTRRR